MRRSVRVCMWEFLDDIKQRLRAGVGFTTGPSNVMSVGQVRDRRNPATFAPPQARVLFPRPPAPPWSWQLAEQAARSRYGAARCRLRPCSAKAPRQPGRQRVKLAPLALITQPLVFLAALTVISRNDDHTSPGMTSLTSTIRPALGWSHDGPFRWSRSVPGGGVETSLIVGLVSSLFGGFIVTLTTYLAGRNKLAAEIRKLDAEAEKSKAETTKLLAELDGKMTKKTKSPDTKAPNGWLEGGSDPEDYEFGVDKDVAIQGSGSGFIWSTPNARGFGTLMQMFKADLYCGKRRRLSAFIRAEEVESWAGLWMRVDGPDGETLAFDNMQQRPIKGTINWRNYQVVLDVPGGAQYIAFGVLLHGQGRIWIDDVKFEVVDEGVPPTSVTTDHGYPDGPTNLDFEQDRQA